MNKQLILSKNRNSRLLVVQGRKQAKIPRSLRVSIAPRTSSDNLPVLLNIKTVNNFGNVFTGTVLMGRNVVTNYPAVSYNSSGVSQTHNLAANFGSSTFALYLYGCVAKCKVTIHMKNNDAVPVETGLVLVPPLQTVTNNTSTDLGPSYVRRATLGAAGTSTEFKTFSFVVDLPSLSRQSLATYISNPANWFSNGGPPTNLGYLYHQMKRYDGNVIASGVDVICDCDYLIYAMQKNTNLTG